MSKTEPTSKSARPKRTQRRSRRRRWGASWLEWLENQWLWSGVFFFAGFWALLPGGLLESPDAVPGAIALRDYIAPRDALVLDSQTTDGMRSRARESVLPVYDFDRERASWLQSQLDVVFAEGRALLSADPEGDRAELLDRLVSSQLTPTLSLSREQLESFAEREFSVALEERLDAVWRSLMGRGVVANKELLLENRLRGVTLRDLSDGSEAVQLDLFDYIGYPDEARQFLEREMARWAGWSRPERQMYRQFLAQNITPNLSFNRQETGNRQEQAAAGVEPAYNQVRRGQTIVRRGDQVTERTAAMVRESFGGRSSDQWLPVAGNAVLLLLLLAVLHFGLVRTNIGQGRARETSGGVLLLMALALFLTRVGISVADTLAEGFQASLPIPAEAYLLGLPYAALALLVSLFYGRSVGLVAGVVFSLLVGRIVGDGLWGDSLWAALFVLAVSMAAVFALERLNQRLAVTRAGMIVGLVGVVTSAMLATFGTNVGLGDIGFLLAAPLIGGFLVSALVSFMVPVLEGVLGHITEIRLMELADTNLPVLRRLAFEAPGSFQHSLMVANLAKAGCEAIGANSVLAYTGALYHDIGKIERPAYFVENQHGTNPHDKLSPSMSSLIVIKHVEEGVELAHEHGLPRPIIDAIEQHHGTRLLKFFHEKAKRQARDSEAVDEHKYRYPGPIPQSKTMGVLMYADTVEAASRTLKDPSPHTIDSLLEQLLESCLAEHQFDDTELTFADLRKVKEAFARTLQTVYHKRVDYPGFDFDDDSGRELRMIRGGSS